MEETYMPEALSDLTVIDLTHSIAGPYCTKLLADYGAEVIKIERPDGGDPARRMGPFFHDDPDPEKSGPFLHLNTNKRSITLNLKSKRGVKIFKELVKNADILVENFSPRVMPGLGLSYETLEEINPKLVMTSISNFGQTGPYRDYKAQDIVMYAMGHSMNSTGLADREPLKMAGNLMQYQAGNLAATATMVGIFGSRFQGIGQHIDISIFETQMGSMDRRRTFLLTYQYSGFILTRREAGVVLGILPNGILPCKDGYVQLATLPQWWPRLVRMLGKPELHEQFPDLEDLLDEERKPEFDAIFLPWLMERTKQEIMEAAQAVRLPITAMNTTADLLKDRHFKEREYFVEIDHPQTGKATYPGAPFKMMETPWKVRRPAPLLGEHNEEIYCDKLGYSKEDLVRLRQLGVI